MTASIHLRYLKGIISDLKLRELEGDLATAGIRFNYEDISEQPQASLEDFLSPIVLVLSSPVFQAYILGLMTNVTYDLLKKSIMSIWQNLHGKKVTKITASGDMTQKEADLDLDICVDEHMRVKFKLKGDIPDSAKEKAIENIFGLLRTTHWDKSRPGFIVIYDKDHETWEIFEDMEYISKFVKKTPV
jgi:hypothetical protein